MTATIIPFTGAWHGRFEAAPYQVEIQTREGQAKARAFHDARLISSAKRNNDDWTARLLLAILQTLTRKQLELVEFRLLGPNLIDASACEALALVHLALGDKRHRENVRSALAAQEAQ